MKIALVVVVDENNGIGKNNKLLCHLPADLKRFKELTVGHSIIMGRKTFESLPNGPLPNRRNIILTQSADYKAKNCVIAHSVKQALKNIEDEEIAFIIGGEQIYKAFIDIAKLLYITKIHHKFDADAFFPEIDNSKWKLTEHEDKKPDDKNKFSFSFRTYLRI